MSISASHKTCEKMIEVKLEELIEAKIVNSTEEIESVIFVSTV